MGLRKVVLEIYSLEKELDYDKSPGHKIIEKLSAYSYPTGSGRALTIPSIPARVCVSERGKFGKSKIEGIDVRFFYLEGSSEEDLEFVRKIILEEGLRRIER